MGAECSSAIGNTVPIPQCYLYWVTGKSQLHSGLLPNRMVVCFVWPAESGDGNTLVLLVWPPVDLHPPLPSPQGWKQTLSSVQVPKPCMIHLHNMQMQVSTWGALGVCVTPSAGSTGTLEAADIFVSLSRERVCLGDERISGRTKKSHHLDLI